MTEFLLFIHNPTRSEISLLKISPDYINCTAIVKLNYKFIILYLKCSNLTVRVISSSDIIIVHLWQLQWSGNTLQVEERKILLSQCRQRLQ